jgi:hypothetical protein
MGRRHTRGDDRLPKLGGQCHLVFATVYYYYSLADGRTQDLLPDRLRFL